MHARAKLGELLITEGVLTQKQLDEALILQQARKKRLGKVLLELGFVTEGQVVQALSRQLDLPVIDLDGVKADKDLLSLITQEDAEKYLVFPISLKGRTLTLAMADPLDYVGVQELSFKTGYNIAPAVCTEGSVLYAIERNYGVEEKVWDLIKTVTPYDGVEFLKDEADDAGANAKTLSTLVEAPPIIRMVTMIIVEAVKTRASDIHIEPRENSVMVRYRVDGDLRDALKLPKHVQDSVISRIKIISSMDITNRRLPQDGTSKLRLDGREVDLRISTLPTLYGEKVVVRILDKSKGLVTLAEVGFPESIMNPLIRILSQPQGFVLVTGPTGSGKSTTLYAVLQQLKSEADNVVTVEEPVEYRIDGVSQVGINEGIGLSFASVLRSVLRQDPDIIMVGEIRDAETVDIAIKSALTGHLVLSTLHTNDTVATITRLIDLGVQPFLVGSSLSCILAQRLLKKICPHCKVEDKETLLAENMNTEGITAAYKGAGCNNCHNTGYHGQTGVFEFLPVTPKLRRLIARKASEEEITAEARAGGMRFMFENAVEKVNQGVTTLDEVFVKVPNLRR